MPPGFTMFQNNLHNKHIRTYWLDLSERRSHSFRNVY